MAREQVLAWCREQGLAPLLVDLPRNGRMVPGLVHAGRNGYLWMLERGGLPIALANGMIENVIGTFELPIGIATNFTVNGKDYLVPMAVEMPKSLSSNIIW